MLTAEMVQNPQLNPDGFRAMRNYLTWLWQAEQRARQAGRAFEAEHYDTIRQQAEKLFGYRLKPQR